MLWITLKAIRIIRITSELSECYMKKLSALFIFLLIAVVVFFNRVVIKDYIFSWQKPELPSAKQYSDVIANESASSADEVKQSQNQDGIASVARRIGGLPRNDSTTIPLEYSLAVPFQSQAPTSDWGMPYQEACEEASLIMADAFFNKRSLTVGEMDERIKILVDWETKKFGYYEDTTAAEVVLIAKEYFGLDAVLDYDVSVDSIKKYLSQNKLVLVPAAGKVLPNPNFKNGGPLYHMLVIRGYTQDKFITNDPGTRKGEEFVYKYNDLLNAIHDWPAAAKAMAGVPPRENGGYNGIINEADMLTGQRVMIVVSK